MPNRRPSGKRSLLPQHSPKALAQGAEIPGHPRIRPVTVWCVTAGVPCQDVSIAGRRAGLAGKRTGLFYDFARILRWLRSPWFIFENVPGLLSSNRGRDFAEVQRVFMAECGYGICWRVLDSQYFGVAQRRRRLFLVGRLGTPCPPQVLFEPPRGGGHPAARGEARTHVAAPLTAGSGDSKPGRRCEDDYNLVASTLSAEYSEKAYRGDGSENVVLGWNADDGHAGFVHAGERSDDAGEAAVSRCAYPVTGHSGWRGEDRESYVVQDVAGTLGSLTGGPRTTNVEGQGAYVIQDVRGRRDKKQHGIGIAVDAPSYTLSGVDRHAVAFALRRDPGGTGQGHNTNYICSPADAIGVRSPAGLPEGFHNPPGIDSPRYRALGNAVTVQVVEWIGRRIVAWEEAQK